MRILMLGNSFTSENDMPNRLAELTGAEVTHHTRGGARLAEQLNPETQMGGLTQAAFQNEPWDYVVLQEMSNGPITSRDKFFKNVALLCERIRENGAIPVLYATWAYKRDSKQLKSLGMPYEEMYQNMQEACQEAAGENAMLLANVGRKFYELEGTQELYAKDGSHPNETGSQIVAETIAEAILADWTARNPEILQEEALPAEVPVDEHDSRLRILYLYKLLFEESDEEHPLSTRKIMSTMLERHNIYMHRTTVPSDIALLRASGIDIVGKRRRAWEYYLADRSFSVPELKLLIDAVQSSRFITEKKSQELIGKLITLTSKTNADKLRRTVHITGRVKSTNEKGYYIVDAIHEAINAGRKISFFYFDLDGKKRQFLRNNGEPYTVSPFDLIWDGDYYYLTGFCDEREAVRTFRVDRIKNRPELLSEAAVAKPKTYDVDHYTTEVFRMFATDEAVEVTLFCDNTVMKTIVDRFGMGIRTKSTGKDHFSVKVKVCTGPTFYRWVFGGDGKIVIKEPMEVAEAYRQMLRQALEANR